MVPNRFEDFHGIDDSFTNEGTKAMVVSQKKGGYISWSNGHLCFIYIYILFLNIHLTCNCLSFVHVDKIHCTYTTGNMVTFRFIFLHHSTTLESPRIR